MAPKPLQMVKNAVLPDGKRCRRLRLGIARGINLEIDFSMQTQMYLGLYEIELNKYLRRLCRPGFRSFDVGAQFGYDALILAKLSRSQVASFECDPDVFEELKRNLQHNPPLANRIELYEGFVGSEDDRPGGKLTLDHMVFEEGVFVPDFIKMDIEGSELEALLGARRILERHNPNLLVETHSAELEKQCIEFVESIGYRTSIINSRKLLPDYRPAAHNRWFTAIR